MTEQGLECAPTGPVFATLITPWWKTIYRLQTMYGYFFDNFLASMKKLLCPSWIIIDSPDGLVEALIVADYGFQLCSDRDCLLNSLDKIWCSQPSQSSVSEKLCMAFCVLKRDCSLLLASSPWGVYIATFLRWLLKRCRASFLVYYWLLWWNTSPTTN